MSGTEISEEVVEAALVRQVLAVAVADVPFAEHVRRIAEVFQVARHELVRQRYLGDYFN